jgi:L-ribulose-5-phosphate 3-epimerase
MQGRLSPPEDGRFQSFPRKSWREEFARARDAGFEYIEWIHDDYGRTANPIFSEAGLKEFDALKKEHGVATPALCGDWFMDFPLIRCTEAEQAARERHLHELIPLATAHRRTEDRAAFR